MALARLPIVAMVSNVPRARCAWMIQREAVQKYVLTYNVRTQHLVPMARSVNWGFAKVALRASVGNVVLAVRKAIATMVSCVRKWALRCIALNRVQTTEIAHPVGIVVRHRVPAQ